ncbi:hypothetical protein SAMN02745116_00189 [Pilibacter termitis]|uniref:Uncharacterized protein n=1 Tax=Pilibacter termitis TaxID=263852 RepID=A0A1T4KCF5_9ENTE|nr:hypothetical protein [Pilibacter termitis]SJZ40066.1 hypothetical protein SAMN02745116_00189 [Pilibacter termitis]
MGWEDFEVNFFQKTLNTDGGRVALDRRKTLKDELFFHVKNYFDTHFKTVFIDSAVHGGLLRICEREHLVLHSFCVRQKSEGFSLSTEELIKVFENSFPSFYLTLLVVGSKNGKNVYYFEFMPLVVNESIPFVQSDFPLSLSRLGNGMKAEELADCFALAFAEMFHTEGMTKAISKEEYDKKFAKTSTAEKKVYTVAAEVVPCEPKKVECELEYTKVNPPEIPAEFMIQFSQMSIENEALRLENQRYHKMLSLDENIAYGKKEHRGKWIVLSKSEIVELQVSIQFLEDVWRDHLELLDIMKNKSERRVLRNKRAKLLEVRKKMFDLRVKKLINELGYLQKGKPSRFSVFKSPYPIKLSSDDYERFVDIVKFSHFIEQENYRIESLLEI